MDGARLYYLGLLRKPVERPDSSSQGRSEMQCVCPDFDPENWGRSLNPVFLYCFICLSISVEAGSHHAALGPTQADSKLLILVPQSPEGWDSRHVPVHPASLLVRSREGDSNTCQVESYWDRLCNAMPAVSFRPDLKPCLALCYLSNHLSPRRKFFPSRRQNSRLKVWRK